MSPLIVMSAPNGARRTKEDHPNLPISPEEIAEEAERCCKVGATMLHMHVRGIANQHSLEPRLYRDAMDAVTSAVGDKMVIQITTEAVGRYSPEAQMEVVRELRPRAVSLAIRELIPDDSYLRKAGEFLKWLQQQRISPQYILYSPEEVKRFHLLRKQGVIPQSKPFVLFVLGRYAENLDLVRTRDLLPFLLAHEGDCPWAVCAFGPVEAAAMVTAAGLGGHVRIGFENNLWRSDGSLCTNNAELVEQVCDGINMVDRSLASIDETEAFIDAAAA